MLVTILYFLPCLVSLLWFVSFSFKVKTPRQVIFMWIQAASVFYFATYALYISPDADYKTMVMMDAINIPVILIILPLIVIYLYQHIRPVGFTPQHAILFIPLFILGTGELMLYYIVGFDDAANLSKVIDQGTTNHEILTKTHTLFIYFTENLVSIISFIFLVTALTECFIISRSGGYRFGDLFRFFFKGNKTTPSRAISAMVVGEILMFLPLVVLGRTFMLAFPFVGILLTMMIAVFRHFTSHVEFYSDNKKEVTLYFLSHLQLSEPQTSDEAKEDTNDDTEETQTKSHASGKIDLVAEKFQRLMDEEKIYKDENLTLLSLSERMGIGRTTLSAMVNNIYGISFRELLNNYRIQAVKDFMVANPTATQETIAFECGFKNASYLNSKFKEVVGDTPLMWLAKHGESSAGE